MQGAHKTSPSLQLNHVMMPQFLSNAAEKSKRIPL